MPSAADVRSSPFLALIGLLTVACSVATPSPVPTASPSGELVDLPVPGRPFDAATILDGMRDSRRPGGVPDQLETDAIVAAVADLVWTLDGEPWTTMSIGGSCGPVRCTLDVGGTRSGSLGEDLWILEVIPASGEVAVLDADLRSMPAEAARVLDRLARAADARIDRDDLLLVSARWLPPPADGTFELSYRSGNEEGSCVLELTVDVGSGEVDVEQATGC